MAAGTERTGDYIALVHVYFVRARMYERPGVGQAFLLIVPRAMQNYTSLFVFHVFKDKFHTLRPDRCASFLRPRPAR